MSPLAIFGGLVLWSVIMYAIGFVQGENEVKRKVIAEVVKRIETEDPKEVVKMVEAAAEKVNLLKAEQERLIKKVLAEVEKKNG